MSKINEVTLPRDEQGNDPNDHRDNPEYIQKLEPESPDPLAWLEDFTVSKAEAAKIADPEFIVTGLVVKGQMLVVAAPPNGGKTTIFFHLSGGMAEQGYKVVYVNADIGAGDAKSFIYEAEKMGVTLLLPDMKLGRSMADVVGNLKQLNDADVPLGEYVFIFDTLKKMTDVINKGAAKRLLGLLRSLTAKGATIILLAHTNKYNSDEGKPIFEGTGDIRSDTDNLVYMIPDKHADGSMTVSVEPDKQRAALEKMSFEISQWREVTRLSEFRDVAADRALRSLRERDQDVIERITEALAEKKPKQCEIIEHCKVHGISKRRVTSCLKRWAKGKGALWREIKGMEKNALFYELVR